MMRAFISGAAPHSALPAVNMVMLLMYSHLMSKTPYALPLPTVYKSAVPFDPESVVHLQGENRGHATQRESSSQPTQQANLAKIVGNSSLDISHDRGVQAV
jgi:hypothetical protein